jgi:hypothetical protein
VVAVKRYKFQALLTLRPEAAGRARVALGRSPSRVVVRARNPESGRFRMFSALVSTDWDGPYRPGGTRTIVTLVVAGDDGGIPLGVGEHFRLWRGSDIGEGVVSRRLFI